MKFEVNTYSSSSTLLNSILFFLLGSILFAYPDTVVTFVSKVFGSVILLFGIYCCIKNYTDVRRDNSTPASGMILGLFSIAVGCVFIFCAAGINQLLRFIAGGYILFIGINRLINCIYLPKKTNHFYSLLVVSILLVMAGMGTILYANLTVSYIGVVIMAYSVLDVIGYIFHKKSDSFANKSTSKKKDKKKDGVIEAVVLEDKTNQKKKK